MESELDDQSDNDLSGACLEGVGLSRSFIDACFKGANLRGARFREANVKCCDFRGADLRDADFRGAALCATQFGGSRLDGAKFGAAYYHSHILQEDEKPDW